MMGLFVENGPFTINERIELSLRKTAWSLDHNMIFIDQPVGTGFSFTNDESGLLNHIMHHMLRKQKRNLLFTGYCNDQSCVADNLYSALEQIYTVFPELQNNGFYVTGESYAGKYVPAISYKIHTMNKSGKAKVIFYKIYTNHRSNMLWMSDDSPIL